MDRTCGTHTSPPRMLAAPTALEGITSRTHPAHCANPACQARGTRPKTARSVNCKLFFSMSSGWLKDWHLVYLLVYFTIQHLVFILIISDVEKILLETEHIWSLETPDDSWWWKYEMKAIRNDAFAPDLKMLFILIHFTLIKGLVCNTVVRALTCLQGESGLSKIHCQAFSPCHLFLKRCFPFELLQSGEKTWPHPWKHVLLTNSYPANISEHEFMIIYVINRANCMFSVML